VENKKEQAAKEAEEWPWAWGSTHPGMQITNYVPSHQPLELRAIRWDKFANIIAARQGRCVPSC